MQRWAHLVVFILGMIAFGLNLDTDIPNEEEDGEAARKVTLQQPTVRVLNRDTRRKIFGRVADSAGIFIYQSAVFLAQWTLVISLECQDGDVGEYGSCVQAAGPTYFWVLMEAIVFYCYMGSNAVYIAYYQVRSSYLEEPDTDSDLNKQTQDFLTYEKLNLTWFAFNFILIVLPPILMYGIDNTDAINNLNSKTQSYEFIMYIIWIMHVVQFLTNTMIEVEDLQAMDRKVDGEKTENLLGR